MAWNGSNGADASNRNAEKGASSVSKGALALVLVVAIGAGAYWFVTNETPKPVAKEAPVEHPQQIAEVEPEVAPTPVVEAPKPKPIDPNARPTKVGEVVNGYVLLPSGRLHKRQGVVTNSVAMRPKGKYHIFERRCNNEIAAYLSMQPGDTLVGTMRYNGRFTKDFLESIKEPIIISPDDTPEQVELKNAVIAARLDLKDAYDRGEDIEKIMADTREELQQMYRYKQELQHEFNQLRKEEGATDQDVEDLFDACNKLLEEKGISPMKFGPITRRRMMSIMNQE